MAQGLPTVRPLRKAAVNSGSSVDNPKMAAQPSYNVSAVPIKFPRNSLSQVTEGDNKMSSAVDSMPDASRLYIGEGVTIKGEITVPDTLVVCGTVEGDVSVGNLGSAKPASSRAGSSSRRTPRFPAKCSRSSTSSA